jgi:hypothetical protein
MHRTIIINSEEYGAEFGTKENCRVTIKNGEAAVSADLKARTPGAEFEAVFYGTERIEIITAPEEGYEIGPLSAPTLADVKAAKKAEINAAKWDDITNGDVEYSDLHFHTDPTSQGLIGNAVQLHGATSVLPAIWRAKDGYLTVTSVSQLIAIGGLIAARIEDLFEREHTLEGDIDAAATAEDVEAVSWNG